MIYGRDTYTDIAADLAKWKYLDSAADTELNLSIINEAQDYLWMADEWAPLKKRATLTIVSGLALVPVDFGKFIDLVYEISGIDCRYVINRDFRFVSAFSKATGMTVAIQFLPDTTVTEPVYMVYKAELEKFIATGTEYSFFPKGLILACAQMRHLEKCGLNGTNDYSSVFAGYQREYSAFCAAVKNFKFNDTHIRPQDELGNSRTFRMVTL
jgi:hypothetical protein